MATLARVELLGRSGLAEDIVVNDFAIDIDPLVSTVPLTDALIAFYTEANASGNALRDQIGPSRRRDAGGAQIKLYDITGHLDGSPHGSPYQVLPFTLGGTVPATGLPEEVAACMTLRGEDWDTVPVERADGGDLGGAPDRPRQRHSGRLFFGPLYTGGTVVDATTGAVRFGISGAASFGMTLLERARDLQLALLTADMAWCVWSRKDAVLYPIVRWEVDNAPDTQRRRGAAPSARVGQNV